MQRQRTRDTNPELAVRRLVHAAGLRYRVDVAPLKGLRRRADIVFGQTKVAVFVDGCFWHGCPQHGARRITANTTYWREKVVRNQDRDADTDVKLSAAGWLIIRCWEHDDPDKVAERIISAVDTRRRNRCQSRTTSPDE